MLVETMCRVLDVAPSSPNPRRYVQSKTVGLAFLPDLPVLAEASTRRRGCRRRDAGDGPSASRNTLDPGFGFRRVTWRAQFREAIAYETGGARGRPPYCSRDARPAQAARFGLEYGRVCGGLGIDLTVVRQLVTLHGGRIGVHSAAVGRESEFVVRLPVALRKLDTSIPSQRVGARYNHRAYHPEHGSPARARRR